MRLEAEGFRTSIGNREEEEMAYVYCADKHSGYCLSLSRFLHNGDELVEMMVSDQVCCSTQDVVVTLSRCELKVELSPSVAQRLTNVADYIVPLTIDDDEFQELDAALQVIFEGGHSGEYDRQFNFPVQL